MKQASKSKTLAYAKANTVGGALMTILGVAAAGVQSVPGLPPHAYAIAGLLTNAILPGIAAYANGAIVKHLRYKTTGPIER